MAQQGNNPYNVNTGYQQYQTQQQSVSQATASAQQQNATAGQLEQQLPALQGIDPNGALGQQYVQSQTANAQSTFEQHLDPQAKQLQQNLDLRSAPGHPGAHYPGYSHQSLHDMVNNNVDPGSVGEVGDTWLDIGNSLTGLQSELSSALASNESEWSGTAADGARQGLADIGNRAAATGQAAQLAGTLQQQASAALSDAKNTMPPVPNPQYSQTAVHQQLMTATSPQQQQQILTDAKTQQAQQQQLQKQAAQVVQTYDQKLGATANSMPAFAPAPPPPPGSGGGGAGGSGGGSGVGGVGGGYGSNVRSGGAGGYGGAPGVGAGGGAAGGGGGYRVPTGPGTGPGVGTGNLGGTGTSDYNNPSNPGTNPGGGNPYGGTGSGYGPGGQGGSAQDGMAAGAGMMGMGGGGGFGGGGGGDTSYGGRGYGSGGGGAGSGAGAGGRSGIGSDAMGGEAGRAGAAGAGKGSSGMGGGGMGGRGGRKEEDEEHEIASYLITEDNGNAIVGEMDPTVPPVIGG